MEDGNMQSNNIKKLSNSYKSQVADISAECFVNDIYFDFLSENKTEKKKKLIDMYAQAFNITIKLGDCFGYFIDNGLVGYVMILDYEQLKNDEKTFNSVFDISQTNFSEDVSNFIKYANNLKKSKYLLSICVNPSYQKRGIGFSLINYIIKKYKNYHLISDVDNKNSLSIYRKLKFDITMLSDKFYIVDKFLTDEDIEENIN